MKDTPREAGETIIWAKFNLVLSYLHEFNSHIIIQFPLSTPLFVDSRYIISIMEIINSRIQLSITSFDISLMILSFSLASFTLSLSRVSSTPTRKKRRVVSTVLIHHPVVYEPEACILHYNYLNYFEDPFYLILQQ